MCLFLLLLPLVALAEYQAGLDAYHSGDYATAMVEWKQAVSQPPAQENLAVYRESLYAIGMLYWQGEGVAQDHEVSAVWLKQAADINHPGAQVKLGYLYSTGQGVPQNYHEAVKWFEMAAAQGDPDAKYNLDLLRDSGLITGSESIEAEWAAAESIGGEMVGAGSNGTDFVASKPVGNESAENEPVGSELVENEPVDSGEAGEHWILEQNPEHYTIQVIALSRPDALRAFIANHPDWSPFAIYGQTKYEKPLWVLVQGNYGNVETARAARDAFPAGLQRQEDLWIRKFGMIQRLIE